MFHANTKNKEGTVVSASRKNFVPTVFIAAIVVFVTRVAGRLQFYL
jgi:hypothetical protein